VIIIDQHFARQYFPVENPIGQKIARTHGTELQPMGIVGVVADIREGPLDKATWPTMYYAFNQDPTTSFSLVVRTSQKEDSVFQAAASAIQQVSPALSISEPISMSDRISHSPAAYVRRSAASLVGGSPLWRCCSASLVCME